MQGVSCSEKGYVLLCFVNMKICVRPADAGDAPIIGMAVMSAVGAEHIAEMKVSVGDAEKLFAALAALADSQYSYTNTLVAVDDEDKVVGVCVAYDGARLYHLRKRFIEMAADTFSIDGETIDDETDASEYYLDSLWVAPEYRKQGIAGKLISTAALRAKAAGKPLGLLCDPDNVHALKLYCGTGFKEIGKRAFMGISMLHMQLRRATLQE